MSEYQRVAFRAIDGPVSKKNLEFMERQSSRAEITPWAFDNEYQYGDFHGNALEMMRRGYDIHLHYANFGTRSLFIRFPNGLPNAAAVVPYLAKDSLRFIKDKYGSGGILSIDPCHEPGELEDLWEFDELLDRLIPLRAEILEGDLRPLYLAHLAMASDSNHDPENTKESPVPAGLGRLSDAQQALAELYGLDDSLLAAAARSIPPTVTQSDPRKEHADWLAGQAEATKDAWLIQLMSDPCSAVRSEILARFSNGRQPAVWPTVRRGLTIAELRLAAAEIQQRADQKAVEKVAREKVKRLAKMAADPENVLRELKPLTEQRTQSAYRQIGNVLAELRESLIGKNQSNLAEQFAQTLKRENPTLRILISELRRQGFLAK